MNKTNYNMESIAVSVIIVNYNGSDLLDECLHSLYEQTQDIYFEVIVIDNGSNDNVQEVIGNYKDIIFIRNEVNKGFGFANNQGLAVARGEYILFLNNDTVFIENSIKITYDFIIKQREECLVGCKLLNVDHSFQQSAYMFPSLRTVLISNLYIYKLFPYNKKANKFYILKGEDIRTMTVDVVIGAFLFVKKSSVLELQGFDSRFYFYHEDTDLCYRYNKDFGKVIYFVGTSIIHKGGATSNRNIWFQSKNRSLSQLQFFQKHYKSFYFYVLILCHYLGLLLKAPIFFIYGIFTLNRSYVIKALYNIRLIFFYPPNLFD